MKNCYTDYPTYPSIQRSIGKVYVNLAKIEDTESNLLKAIRAFNEAIRTEMGERSYYCTNPDLGNAYISLAKEI